MPILVRQELAALESEIALCERCYGPERRYGVRFQRPGGAPRVLVIVERPTRATLVRGERLGLGQDDPGMRFLGRMLRVARIEPELVVVGAAAFCRPASRSLEASVPVATCYRECSAHVVDLLRLTEPRLIITLGRAALQSIRYAHPDQPQVQAARFPELVGKKVTWEGRVWMPLYHITARARVTRPEPLQMLDWKRVGRVWKTLQTVEV